ncbi:MAG: AIR synthase-related protein [Candidatus Nealsonbacteria bacterium]
MYEPIKPYKKKILELVKETWETPYVSIRDDIYPIIEKKFSYPEIDHTDGIGTKGIYHWRQGTLRNAVLDALAMNLNDLAIVRAVPYKLQNHIIIPEEDERILKIIEALSEECKKRKIAITGGETSIHNNINGLDISMTISGFIKKSKENKFKEGDALIGFRSNGLHSNGFTKVREVFGEEDRAEFIEPTKIYLDEVLNLNSKFDIHGMMHITGGAYSKLKDLLENTDVEINKVHKLEPQSIFKELYKRGVSDEEMYKTFNCGIGFILSVSSEDADNVITELDADIIGKVVSGTSKIKIESMFSDKLIEL